MKLIAFHISSLQSIRSMNDAYIARSALSDEAFTCNTRSRKNHSWVVTLAKGSAPHCEVQ